MWKAHPNSSFDIEIESDFFSSSRVLRSALTAFSAFESSWRAWWLTSSCLQNKWLEALTGEQLKEINAWRGEDKAIEICLDWWSARECFTTSPLFRLCNGRSEGKKCYSFLWWVSKEQFAATRTLTHTSGRLTMTVFMVIRHYERFKAADPKLRSPIARHDRRVSERRKQQ